MDFAKKTFSIFKFDVSTQGVAYFLRLIIAGILGPMNFGIFSLISLIPEYSEKLLRFSVDDASIHIAGKSKYELGQVFSNSAFLMFCLSFLPVFLFIWQGEIFYKLFLKDPNINRTWIWITLAGIPFIFLFRSVVKLLIFLERVGLFNKLNLFVSLFGYVLGICFIVLFKMGIFGILFALTLSYFFGSIIGIILISQIIHPGLNLNFNLIKELIVYGFKIHVPNIFLYLHLRADMLIVAFFLTPVEVGYYALAVSMAEVLRKIPISITSILYSRTSRLSGEEAKILTVKSCRISFIILCCVLTPFYFIIKIVIMPFLGKSFSPIMYPLVILMPGIIGLSIGQLLITHFYGRGYPLSGVKPVAMGLIINVLMNFWLVPKIGIIGAAFSSSVSYIIFSILSVDVFKNTESILIREMFIPTVRDFKYFKKFFYSEFFKPMSILKHLRYRRGID